MQIDPPHPVLLYHGNCLTVLSSGEAHLEEDSVDACITDPPYSAAFMGTLWEKFKGYKDGVQRPRTNAVHAGKGPPAGGETTTRSDGQPVGPIRRRKGDRKLTSDWAMGGVPGAWSDHFYESSDEFEAFFRDWLVAVFRVLKPGGHCVFFGCVKLLHVYIALAIRTGFRYKDLIVWDYGRAKPCKGRGLDRTTGNPEDAHHKSMLPSAYEPVVVLQKPWQQKRNHPPLSTVWRQYGTGFVDTRALPANLLHVSPVGRGERGDNPHYAVKPVALMEALVRCFAPEGGVVLDPFMGSGTTMAACLRTGRRGCGIELEKEFFDFAQQRVRPSAATVAPFDAQTESA